MEYRIVRATQDRMAQVAKAFRKSRRATYPDFPELHSADEDIAFFRDSVFEKNQVFVAESADSGAILGFIAFSSEWIDHLYLLPESQFKGIGTQLLHLAQKSASHLQLWTFQTNKPARMFYKKHGFIEIKETDGAENEEKQPDVLMEWRR